MKKGILFLITCLPLLLTLQSKPMEKKLLKQFWLNQNSEVIVLEDAQINPVHDLHDMPKIDADNAENFVLPEEDMLMDEHNLEQVDIDLPVLPSIRIILGQYFDFERDEAKEMKLYEKLISDGYDPGRNKNSKSVYVKKGHIICWGHEGFKCNYCGKEFNSNKNLYRHFFLSPKRAHEGCQYHSMKWEHIEIAFEDQDLEILTNVNPKLVEKMKAIMRYKPDDYAGVYEDKFKRAKQKKDKIINNPTVSKGKAKTDFSKSKPKQLLHNQLLSLKNKDITGEKRVREEMCALIVSQTKLLYGIDLDAKKRKFK